ncbi:universal stress protein [Halomicrococcus gelatinilyticus]|uniref:universal stress protein n=1 Tax=Halomicrococcus gelatinilyticus TaxID=1702103 RepID=UPI002E15F872
MTTLLVPLDNDPARAENQAAFVESLPGRPDEVTVVLTHVLVDDERDAPAELQHPDRAETVRDVRGSLADAGYDVEIAEAASPPSEGILDLADDLDVDMVVMGTRKRTPAGKAIFGSVTQSVVLDASVPVVVTGGDETT